MPSRKRTLSEYVSYPHPTPHLYTKTPWTLNIELKPKSDRWITEDRERRDNNRKAKGCGNRSRQTDYSSIGDLAVSLVI
jgi:hypothetical protein